MPRTRKAAKRAASRRHRASSTSINIYRPSSHVVAATSAQPASPASASSTQTPMPAPMIGTTQPNHTPAPTPPCIVPLPDSPTYSEHQDRRAHPDQAALKERAFSLSCIGLRSPAIAARLGVSERTIRHWNRATLQTLALDATDASPDLALSASLDGSDAGAAAPDTRSTIPNLMEYHRALAIERQLDIAVTARAAYDRLMAQHDHLLAQYTAACDANIAATSTALAATAAVADEASPAPPLPAAVANMARLLPQLASSASRQLQIAQVAHREVARLQGVPAYAQTDARLSAEYDVRQSLQAGEPDEEQGGHVPVHFFDANAAIDELCGPEDDDEEDGDDEDKMAIGASPHDAPSGSAAKTANAPGNNSGNISGNNFGNVPATSPATKTATGSSMLPKHDNPSRGSGNIFA